MAAHTDALRLQLAQGPQTSRALQERTGLSQPTVSRALSGLGGEVLAIGTGRARSYALRDAGRGLSDLPVYRVDAEGQLAELGVLSPVRPDGYLMRQGDGVTLHSEGLPWWLVDMRPQGFLGRAYAGRCAAGLGLPTDLSAWTDAHALRALVAHGHDAVGNLLLGEHAREQFLAAAPPVPMALKDRPAAYAALAAQAAAGEAPGSSAGGEQPKFTACVLSPSGLRHVLVKFSIAERHAVARRWRDLLLAEHLALTALREAGVSAARTELVDHGDQRFLEVERFDRVGERGRRAVLSLGALDDEFVGRRTAPWPEVARQLARLGHLQAEAADAAALLHAFGSLIGNTDMHAGNLSFVGDSGRPYALAPAYDMLPMGFAPSTGGALRDSLGPLQLAASVAPGTWRQALALGHDYLHRLGVQAGFSPAFTPCLEAMAERLLLATEQIARLAD